MQASKRPTVTISEYVLRSIWSINFAKLIRINELNKVEIAYTKPNSPSVSP